MAEHVKSRYESALRACNAVDFDDLILLVLRLVRRASRRSSKRAATGFCYVMVDWSIRTQTRRSSTSCIF